MSLLPPSLLRSCGVALALLLAWPLAAAAVVTTFPTSPVSVVLSGSGTRSGECTGRLEPATGRLELACTHDMGDGAVLRLRRGSATGAVVQELATGSIVTVDAVLGDVDMARGFTGQLFLTLTSPQGTISSRLLPREAIGEQVMRFPLSQDSLVFSGSSATGHCALRIGPDQTDVDLLCHHDVDDPAAILTMKDGGVVASHAVSGNPIETSLPEIGLDWETFVVGHYGIILTSDTFPNGEIAMVADRCRVGPTTLCLNEGRFAVTLDFTPPGQSTRAAGTARPRSSDSGLFWFFAPDNWEAAIKVLNACGVNQRFWVFLSANTNVAFEATVYDTITGRTWTHTNPQGNLAAPRADTGAFPCA